MKKIKQKLYHHCQLWIEEKIKLAQNVIQSAQASSNEETKSSAGDKYETARAMAQLEIEKGSLQLAEASKLLRLMNEFSANTDGNTIGLGSLTLVNNEWFYLSISAGKVILDDIQCICLSPAAPLGAMMMRLKIGDTFCFNKQVYTIVEIH